VLVRALKNSYVAAELVQALKNNSVAAELVQALKNNSAAAELVQALKNSELLAQEQSNFELAERNLEFELARVCYTTEQRPSCMLEELRTVAAAVVVAVDHMPEVLVGR
jgi:hypothetical protein